MARRPDVDALVAQRDVPGLMDALRFEDASVRRDAAAALGRLGNTAAWSRRTAAGALCQVLAGYEETAAHEHRSLRHPSGTATTRLVRETPEVRLAAIEALALLATAEPRHASPALSALLDQTSASGEHAPSRENDTDPELGGHRCRT